MRNSIKTLMTLALFITSPSFAAQYEVFVSQPLVQMNPSNPLVSLSQKSILIDTQRKIVRVPVSVSCAPNQICVESNRWLQFTLTMAQGTAAHPTHFVASYDQLRLEISINQNNSSTITFLNHNTVTEASFIGSPARPTQFLAL
jgi:hypothetical protein